MAEYRADIDGLRALAVGSVLFYHVEIAAFSGGYVGVDVFFVISGYLIIKILLAMPFSLASMLDFYVRRIRRIMPALLVTLLLSYLASFVLLPPEHFAYTSKATVAALLSVSNILFSEAGYFSVDHSLNPLLHTWSLGVEEQFYLVWPIVILALAATLKKPALVLVMVVGSAASVLCSELLLDVAPRQVFFWTPFRAAEFGIGALCLFVENWRRLSVPVQNFLSVAGTALILYAIFTFTGNTRFPGINALIPSLGTAALLLSPHSAMSQSVLSHGALRKVGTISYSLYLTHWPVYVFYKYLRPEPLQPADQIVIVALATAIAMGIYHSVENPIRRRRVLPRARGLASAALAAGFVVAAPAGLSASQDGWVWRLAGRNADLYQQHRLGYTPCAESPRSLCAFGDLDAPRSLFVFGDSLAQHLVSGLHEFAVKRGLRGDAIVSGGCTMLAGLRVFRAGAVDETCTLRRDRALAFADERDIELVVISNYWPSDRVFVNDAGEVIEFDSMEDRLMYVAHALQRTLDLFKNEGRRIIVIGLQVHIDCEISERDLVPGPITTSVGNNCNQKPRTEADEDARLVNQIIGKTADRPEEGIIFIKPEEILCDAEECLNRIAGLSLYRDRGHFTVAGSRYFMEKAAPYVPAIALAAPGS